MKITQPSLAIALVQADTQFDSVSANLAMLEELIETAPQADIYLLPELFNTGYQLAFSARPEAMGLETTRWMTHLAHRKNAAICGSIAVAENGQTRNRMLFVTPDGPIQYYDKVKVFRFSGEHKVFSPGHVPGRFQFRGWEIKPIICFDLRFPEVVRNEEPYYDLILCSAHWPQPRIDAWDKLLMARAIENQSFLAAVNRFGTEGEAFYPGHSAGLDFAGNPMCKVENAAGVYLFTIHKADLDNFRSRFPFLAP